MKHFYLSTRNGISGICKYSHDFYELVLKDKGYTFIDSSESVSSILSAIASRDHVHIEIGIFQKKEIEVLFLMLKANYINISVTLHDAPLVKYPFHEFRNPFLNKLSKFYDLYGNNSDALKKYVQKIKSIYVLSKKGQESVKKKYAVNNVHYLPHIVNTAEIRKSEQQGNHFIYFGFIGRNKGLEYSLQLHETLLTRDPGTHFYIAGTAMGKEKKFYEYLQKRYRKNVHYLGYVPEEQLGEIFDRATFALIPFREYGFFYPFSGSILYSLKKGKIVFTNSVNCIPEIIENGKRGFYLSGNLKKDSDTIRSIFSNAPLLDNIRNEVYQYLWAHHCADQVKKSFNE